MVGNVVIASAVANGRTHLNEVESKQVLAGTGIPVVETRLASSREEAVSHARALGFPTALKIVSPDVIHKTDAGGVKLNLQDEAAVAAGYDEIMQTVAQREPQARLEGVAVQPMAREGIEVILGMSKDPQFGPVLMFGLGGILVEVLKDVSFRIVPLTRYDASQMIREIKGFPVLDGYRGRERADLTALEDMLLRLSDFAEQNPEVAEIDLNPVLAYHDGAIAVDARIILESAYGGEARASAAANQEEDL